MNTIKKPFTYTEMVKDNLQNRGNYLDRLELSTLLKSGELKKFNEYWRGMFSYKISNPTEKDSQLGNFFIESDEPAFNLNQIIILTAVEYLHKKYDIPYNSFNFFVTNKSIWCEIPFIVFGCKGSIKLNEIYKKMATEINETIVSQPYICPYTNQKIKLNGLDLSIYKWNGLIHNIGSYLPITKKRVSKFTYNDLENADTIEDLRTSKIDLFYPNIEAKTSDKASKWYNKLRKEIIVKKSNNKKKNKPKLDSKLKLIIEQIEEFGVEEGNRNNGLCSYSFALKDLGVTEDVALVLIKKWLKKHGHIDYSEKKEVERSVHSVYSGKHHFSIRRALDIFPDLEIVNLNKSTFIIPREFIKKLNENKVGYKTYRYLAEILYTEQCLNKKYKYNLNKERHKNFTIKKFEELKNSGIIDFYLKGNEIEVELILKEKKTYRSYIMIPVNFILSKKFRRMKQEIKVLFELWRSSINSNNKTFFNINKKTLSTNLHCSIITIEKQLRKLKKIKLILNKNIVTTLKEYSQQLKYILKKYSFARTPLFLDSNNKMIYSPFPLTLITSRYKRLQGFKLYIQRITT